MARARGLGPRGREFESRVPEMYITMIYFIQEQILTLYDASFKEDAQALLERMVTQQDNNHTINTDNIDFIPYIDLDIPPNYSEQVRQKFARHDDDIVNILYRQ